MDLFHQFRTSSVVIEEDSAFSQQGGEPKRIRKVFLDGLVSMVANICEAVADTKDFMTIGLSLDEGDQVDIAVERKSLPSSRPDEDDADKVTAPSAFDMP
jgi:hypothetical protein